MYTSDGAHNYWGSWPGAFVANAVTNSDLDKVILQDCITNLRSDHFVYSRHNRDYGSRYSQEASAVFTNINMSYEVPFNLDGSVSAGTVSFVDGSSGVNNYRLAWSPDNLAVQYAANATVSGTDITGRARGSDYSVAAIPIPPVLDDYSGAAAAYSVRLLNSSYTGSCMEVQRGDGEYQSIGFDSNGDLDIAAIKSFCDADTGGTPTVGRVRTWYDQSGNGNDMTQSTAGSQPRIYDGSAVELENGKPVVRVTSSLNTGVAHMTSTLNCVTSNGWVFVVAGSDGGAYMGHTTSAGDYALIGENTGSWASTNLTGTTYLNGGEGGSADRPTVFFTMGSQGLGVWAGQTGKNTSHTYRIGYLSGIWQYLRMQEMVIYHSDQSSNRTGIESNINAYYDIYNDPNRITTTVTWGDYPDAGAYELYPDLFLKAGFGNVYINLYNQEDIGGE
jgi:hypothetical protein